MSETGTVLCNNNKQEYWTMLKAEENSIMHTDINKLLIE